MKEKIIIGVAIAATFIAIILAKKLIEKSQPVIINLTRPVGNGTAPDRPSIWEFK